MLDGAKKTFYIKMWKMQSVHFVREDTKSHHFLCKGNVKNFGFK